MMKQVWGVVLAVGFALSGLQGSAQAQRRVVVHAGHLLDVKSGKTLNDQTIFIEDGKIVSVRSRRPRRMPAMPSGSNCRMRQCCPD